MVQKPAKKIHRSVNTDRLVETCPTTKIRSSATKITHTIRSGLFYTRLDLTDKSVLDAIFTNKSGEMGNYFPNAMGLAKWPLSGNLGSVGDNEADERHINIQFMRSGVMP